MLDAELRKLVPEEGLTSDYFKIQRNRNYIFGTSTVAVPSKVFSEPGGFHAGYWWGEDIDMWCRIALKYPVAYTSQACATYFQNTVNSTVKKKKAIKTHPFVKTARKALNSGEVPREVIEDLTEYVNLIEMDTAIHDICIGGNSLAFSLLTRNDTSISSKTKLLHILSTYSKNNMAGSSKFISRKRRAAVKFVNHSSVSYRQGQADTRKPQVNLLA